MGVLTSIKWTHRLLDRERFGIARPLSVVHPIVTDETWTVATNGWVMLIVSRDLGYEQANDVMVNGVAAYISRINAARPSAISIELAALRTFVGQGPVSYNALMKRMDDHPTSICAIGDALFNRELLAQWLQHLPDGKVGLTLATYAGDDREPDEPAATPLILHGADWTLTVMPIADHAGPRSRAAVFPLDYIGERAA